MQLAMDADVSRLGLFHHNQDRTDDAIDAIVGECRAVLQTREKDIDCFAVYQDMEWVLE